MHLAPDGMSTRSAGGAGGVCREGVQGGYTRVRTPARSGQSSLEPAPRAFLSETEKCFLFPEKSVFSAFSKKNVVDPLLNRSKRDTFLRNLF